MQPLYFNVGAGMPVMILPDVKIHLDGHPVLTYTYNIFKNGKHGKAGPIKQDMQLTKSSNPDYMGYITFEEPGKLFSYTADGQQDLNSGEVQEIIETITHYRENPSLWEI